MHETSLGVLFPGRCFRLLEGITPQKTNMTIENPPFEDVFSIEKRRFSNVGWFLRVFFTSTSVLMGRAGSKWTLWCTSPGGSLEVFHHENLG